MLMRMVFCLFLCEILELVTSKKSVCGLHLD